MSVDVYTKVEWPKERFLQKWDDARWCRSDYYVIVSPQPVVDIVNVKRAALVQASIREIIGADSNRYGLDQGATIRRAYETCNIITLRDVDTDI